MKNMRYRIAICFVIVFSFFFSLINVSAQSQWELYENKEYGFSIKYPAEWAVKTTITNSGLGDGVIEKRIFFSETDELGVHIDIFPNESDLEVLEWYYAYQDQFLNDGGSLQTDLLIAGKQAVYSFDPEDSQSAYPRHTVIVINGSYVFRIEYSASSQIDYLNTYREMLSTVSFENNRSETYKLFSIDPSMLTTTEIRVQSCCDYVDPNYNPYVCHYGNCTWWAKYKRPDTGGQDGATWGNASEWPARAIEEGFVVNSTPEAGALITGGSWTNHVAYVESYNGSRAYLSDMDYSATDCKVDRWYQSTLSGFTFIHRDKDTTPPTSSISLSGTVGENSWYKTSVNLTISASDSGSGVDYSQCNLNGTGWKTYNGTFNVSVNGTNTVQYRSVDNSGNWESTKSKTIKIDNVAPINPTAVNPGCVASTGVWQNTCSDPTFSWSGASDATSGVAGFQYYWGTSSTGTSTSYTTGTSYNPAAVGEGTYYLRIRTKDNAGNYAAWKTMFVLKYDGTSPTGTLQINDDYAQTYRTLVKLNPTGSDALSGARFARFRNQGGSWTDWQGIIDTDWVLPAVTGQTYTVEAEIMDAAGNVSTLISDSIALDIYPDQPSSSNFSLVRSTFGMSATNASSSSYQLHGTLSQPSTIGSHESTNYQLTSGFWSWLTDLFADPVADLSLTKTASTESVYSGEEINYTLEITNSGPDAAEGITVLDTLPPGVTYHSAVGTGWSCSEASGEVTCTRSSLDISITSTITIVVTAPESSGTIVNNASVSSITDDNDLTNNADSDDVLVNLYSDLLLSKTASEETVNYGDPFTYTLTVENLGPGEAFGIMVSDTLPEGVVYGSAVGTGWDCDDNDGEITCTLASLDSGSTSEIIILVTAPGSAGTIVNSATVTSSSGDDDLSNNEASNEVVVKPIADLVITKTASVSQVGFGIGFSYTLTIEYLGETDAANVVVVDSLPAGVVLQSISGTGWACDINSVSCSRDVLTAGSTSTITLIVTAPETEGSITNTATVSSDLTEDDPGNNSDNCSVTVMDIPALDNINYLPLILK